ncbi:MAG: hypothetical protein H0U50_11995 [Pyrinomonadaceae bacterium]|nr:hypothetical protein [Pyrinomonadaceae bacterium]
MQIIENENGTFKLTAENEMENRLCASISDIIWNGNFSSEFLNSADGCIIDTDNDGKETVFNFVIVPEAAIFSEGDTDKNPYLLSGDELQKTVDFRVAGH